jgi:phenylacetate-coenzyme A ligase PaaK-like adenylate-forming protein
VELSVITPFGLERSTKQAYLLAELNRLTRTHYDGCPEYRRLLDVLHGGCPAVETLEAIPYLPVRLFKHYELLSVPREEVVKTMTSSGTSGQAVSKIFLDKLTASFQIKVLAGIVANFMGKHRLPMLVIDCPSTVSNRLRFSARTAGILGFSMFGRDVTYALNDVMELDLEKIRAFVERHADEDILVFGFTAIVWEHLVQQLEAMRLTLPLSRGIVLHGGGWKNLLSVAVTKEEFKARLTRATGIVRVHNYYGMVEQTGSIFMECEAGHLHSSSYSEIIIRDPLDFSVRGIGESGLIHLLSVIPHSYPGHSLLSEDLGELTGIDNCSCGRKGKTFKVHGRIKNAEVRGCSDAYSS